MKVKITITTIIFMCLVSFSLQGIPNYSFINYSTRDGLSQNFVSSVFMDSRGYIWISTNFGLNKFNGNNFVQYFSGGLDGQIDNDIIQNVTEDKNGHLWILTDSKVNRFNYIKNEFKVYLTNATSLIADKKGKIWITTKRGLELYDEKSDKFNLFEKTFTECTLEDVDNKGNLYLMLKNVIMKFNTKSLSCGTYIVPVKQNITEKRNSLYVDSESNIWIGTPTNGCYILYPETDIITQINNKLLNKLVSGECSDITGFGDKIFYATAFNGLIVYNKKTNQVNQISIETKPKNTIANNNINHVYVDKQGGLWLGTVDYGLEYCSPFSNNFEYFNGTSTPFKTVGNFAELGDAIYIGSEIGLLRKKKNNTKVELLTFLVRTSTGNKTFIGGKFIHKEDESHLWQSSYKKGLHLCNIKTKKSVVSIFDEKFNIVKNITRDSKNRHWILSRTNFGRIEIEKNRIDTLNAVNRLFKNKAVNFNCMALSKEQSIYIGTREFGLLKYYPEGDSCVIYSKENTNWMNHNFIAALHVDNDNTLWIGTYGAGINSYNPKTGSFKNYDTHSGLINNCINGITEDKSHTIWCSSIAGLSSINKKAVIKNYSEKNGFPIIQATSQSIAILSDNQIVVGGNNGFTLFTPNNTEKNNIVPAIEFTEISINGEKKEQEKINADIRNISKSDYKITINYNSFPIEINYSTIGFTYPEMNKFAYKLSSVSDEWVDIGNDKSFLISDLKPGEYTFTLKACNSDGVWNDQGISLTIKVRPPFWLSWWAYLFYFIIIGGLVLLFLKYYKSKLSLENDLIIKQIEKSKIEQFYERKLVLFTNFSHELRTPLTLISGPVEELLKNKNFDEKNKYLLGLIKNNSNRLLVFVNQLMDLRKLETGNYQLHKTLNNIHDFSNQIINDFKNLAASRDIELQLIENESTINIVFDKLLLESVFFNLLSNAFKFTPKKGKIVVSIGSIDYSKFDSTIKNRLAKEKTYNQYLEVTISDTGKGIKDEHLEHVFNQFYQIEEGLTQLTDTKGTGVGLHLTNQIINLHEGTIFAERNVYNGTSFRFFIPLIQECEETTQMQAESEIVIPEPITADFAINETQKSSFTILVVDDDYEIRHYICQHLSNTYKIIEAENGKEALDIILSKDISLVISDVMMPEMDGLELCKSIKANINISDIPVILLTARTADEHIIQGFDFHADDYIPKPFNIDLLSARVKNMLHKHIVIRQKYSTHINVENIETKTLTLDDKFMNKVFSLINENIEDTAFELENICTKIGISKVHLNRKIKSLTGLTPSKLILKTRLNKATQMIAKGEKSITELAYACGFSDANYFSRCFKQEYKVTPTEYLKIQKDQNQA